MKPARHSRRSWADAAAAEVRGGSVELPQLQFDGPQVMLQRSQQQGVAARIKRSQRSPQARLRLRQPPHLVKQGADVVVQLGPNLRGWGVNGYALSVPWRRFCLLENTL